jgi:EmrB/QacA subfamily drug resistance transporter
MRALTRSEAAGTASKRMILAFLCVAQFMVILDVSIVNVALPSIQRAIHVSEHDLQYVVTAYGTLLGGFLLLGGRLADAFGRRRMLQIGLLIFAVSSLAAGLSQGTGLLIVARGLEGFGAAIIAPAALSILTNVFTEGAERNKALGIWGSLAGLGSVCGALFGGLLSDGPGWRWIFFINVPIGIAAAVVAALILPESRERSRSRNFDTLGAVFLTGALLLLIYTINEAVTVGWATPRTIGSIAGSVALLGLFVVVELRAKSPLIPLGIFRRATLRTANIINLVVVAAFFSLFFFASLFMQQVLGYSALKTGLAYVPLALTVAASAAVASVLVTKVAPKPVLVAGLTLTTTGLLLLSRLPLHSSYAVDLLPAFLIVGAGLGFTFVPVQIAAFVGVQEHESGLAAGLINTSQEAGGALGVAALSTVVFTRVNHLLAAAHGNPSAAPVALASGFHRGFFIGACLAGLALLLSTGLLPSMKSAPAEQEEPAIEAAAA